MAGDFNRLLDILMPSKKGIVAVLEAYFDESERVRGIFCVAGFAFFKPQAKKLAKEWIALFPEGCRMSELASGNGRFRNRTKPERERLQKDAVRNINRRMTFGVAVSCDLREIEKLLPKGVEGFEHAYPVCCGIAMTSSLT